MTALLSWTLFGTPFVNWLLYLGLLVLALVGTRLVYWLVTSVIKKLVRKTKTQLDDLLIDALQKPVVVLVFLAVLDYGKNLLVLSSRATLIYNQVINVGYIIAATWFVVKFIDAVLANYLLPLAKKSSSTLDDTLFPLVKGVVNFILYALAIIFVIDYLGFEVTSLLAGLGIGGLAFALAAQDVLSNFFGGAAVITDKPFKVGDRILIDGKDGFVRKIGIRSTSLETFDGTMVVLPNKTVAASVLENISAERARRVKVILGVEYGTTTKKLEKAKAALANIVLENKSTEDKSLIHFKAFGPSSLDLQLIYWIRDLDNILGAQDEINFAIKKEFEKLKIDFAFPSQTVYVRK